MNRYLTLICCALLAAAPAGAQAPHVDNADRPADGRVSVVLEPEWTLGGEADSEHFFGIVGQVFADGAGDLFLVDNQLAEVQVYAPDGRWLRTLGRRGGGPGEVQNLRSALLLPDGSLGLVQAFPGQVVTVGQDGTPGAKLVPGRADPAAGGFMALNTAASRGGTVAFSSSRMVVRGESAVRTSELATYDADGTPRGEIVSKAFESAMGAARVSEAQEDFADERWALGPDGKVYVAPERNVYRIDVHAPDGTLLRSFGRAYEPVVRTAGEKAEARDMLQPWRRRGREALEFDVLETEPDIVRLHVRRDGEVWVLTSRGVRETGPGELAVYDVFDPSGRFVRQAGLVCAGDPRRDALFPVGPDRWVLVRGHAEAVRSLFGMAGDGGGDGLLEIVSLRERG